VNLSRYRPHFCVGLTLVVLLSGLTLAVAYIVHKYVWATEALETMEPRYARMLGLHEAATKVAESRAAAGALLARYAYPETLPADRVGTELQQRLRAAAEAAGVVISGSQLGSGKAENGVEDVPVTVSLEAENAQLLAMLQTVSEQEPIIHVDSLTLQQPRNRLMAQRLVVQARFSVLRQLP
jgi:general secretion pathway protein M